MQSACWALLASAFILSAILIVELGALSGSTAKANMVIDRDAFALMTAQTASNQESLFIVDNRHGYLLMYEMNLPDHRMVLTGAVNLNRYFGGSGNTNQGNLNQNPRRQRR